VETSVVSAPIEAMVAPLNGYISNIYVIQGQKVLKNKPLIKIDNIDLERDLQLARVQLEEAKLNVSYYENLISNEQQRLSIYKNIGSERVISAQTLVNTSKQEVLREEKNVQRMNALYNKHYLSKSDWELELAKFAAAKEKLRNVKAQQNLENHSLHAVDKGMYFTGNKLEGTLEDLEAELKIAQKKVFLNTEKVKIYNNLNNKLLLLSPFDGIVTQIVKMVGSTTDNVKPIILLEPANVSKFIVSYLTQDEITRINTVGIVKLYTPSTGKTYHGYIAGINRTDGFIDLMKTQYRWRDFQIDRSAMIMINIHEKDKKNFDKQTYSGMPIIAYFSRRMIF
jgi:multidrug resistance efflux pump